MEPARASKQESALSHLLNPIMSLGHFTSFQAAIKGGVVGSTETIPIPEPQSNSLCQLNLIRVLHLSSPWSINWGQSLPHPPLPFTVTR